MLRVLQIQKGDERRVAVVDEPESVVDEESTDENDVE